MRPSTIILGGAALFLAGCAPSEFTVEQQLARLGRTTGTIVGVVREAGTNQPLDGVLVGAQHVADETDANGRFKIRYIKPGEVEVTAWRRDLVETHARARVLPGQETSVDLTLERTQPPCCRLAGTWSVLLVLGKPGQLPAPLGTEVMGDISFSPNAPDPFPESRRRISSSDPTLDEFGTYNIDLRPILGENITRAVSTTVVPGRPGSDILKEAEGFVHHRNQVDIDLIPRMSHGGISFTGTITGDEVRGDWIKRDFAPSISGTFVMRRQEAKQRE